MDSRYDLAVIGGGIVGTATAMRLIQNFPDARILLIEKEPEVGAHQTSHNSGVIHSGIYYAPGSLKARLCVEGAREMVRFAEENSLPFELCGKLILASEEKEIPWLKTLFERGKANGVPGLEWAGPERIREIEPNAAGLCGIYSPKTGIIAYREIACAMARRFEALGGIIKISNRVESIQASKTGCVIRSQTEEFEARYFINCGGLHADRIARIAGLEPKVRIVPFRGEYYLIRPERSGLVRNLIYPVPHPDLPFLGVHFTRTIDGKLEAGPNAVIALAREGYKRQTIHGGECAEIFSDPRVWKMMRKYWRTGIFEFYRAMDKNYFTRELKKFVPQIESDDLIPGPSGVRAQCIDENGTLVNDFQIIEAARSIHVLNVPSPAATASLAIAGYILKWAAEVFDLKPKPAGVLHDE